jgi:hypothetical protein
MENYQGNGRQIDFLSVLSALVVNRIKKYILTPVKDRIFPLG